MIEMPENGAEGLGLSLIIYVTAITAAFSIIATPIYFAIQPTQVENPGLAAYNAPPGTRLYPILTAKTETPGGALRVTKVDDRNIVRR